MSDQTIKTMTQSIIDGYRLKKDDAFVQDMLTMPLAALQEGAGALQRHFAATMLISAPSSMLEADAAAKTANTAPKLPAITQAVKNTIFLTKRPSWKRPKWTRTPVPTALPWSRAAAPSRERISIKRFPSTRP